MYAIRSYYDSPQRAARDVPEERGRGSAGVPRDRKHGLRREHVGQADMHVGYLGAQDVGAVSDDVHLPAVEQEVGVDPLDARPAFRVIQNAAAHVGRYEELPGERVGEP